MSLNYDLTAIADRQTLHADDAEWQVTQAIIFATMAVGIGDLTEANVPEFAARVSLVERLNGAFLRAFPSIEKSDGSTVEGVGDPVDRPITVDDLKRRVGLKTNVFPLETRSKFLKRQAGGFLSDTASRLARA